MSYIVVHFPDGSKEFVYPSRELEEGDVVWHDGVRYRVLSIAQNDGEASSAIVEPDRDRLGNLLTSEEGALRLEPSMPV